VLVWCTDDVVTLCNTAEHVEQQLLTELMSCRNLMWALGVVYLRLKKLAMNISLTSHAAKSQKLVPLYYEEPARTS